MGGSKRAYGGAHGEGRGPADGVAAHGEEGPAGRDDVEDLVDDGGGEDFLKCSREGIPDQDPPAARTWRTTAATRSS